MRFIEIGVGGWDHHMDLKNEMERSTAAVDQPMAALLADLKQRGLLQDTLVVWAGEFGRTPFAQFGNGRDHNNRAFTIWMAGGGVKAGYRHGVTDDYGREGVEDRVHIHDLHATILHLPRPRTREAHLPLQRPRLSADGCERARGAGGAGVMPPQSHDPNVSRANSSAALCSGSIQRNGRAARTGGECH